MSSSIESSAVSGVIDWYGPMNLLSHRFAARSRQRQATRRRRDSWESSMVGVPLQVDPARTLAASPISYVHAGAPPVQIHHGTVDTLVPYAQSVEFADALRNAGGDVELIAVDGSDHFWTGRPTWPPSSTVPWPSPAASPPPSRPAGPSWSGAIRYLRYRCRARESVGIDVSTVGTEIAPNMRGGDRDAYARAGMTSLANMRIDRWVSALLMPG